MSKPDDNSPPEAGGQKTDGPLRVAVQLFVTFLMVPTAFFAVAFAFGLFSDAGPGSGWLAGGAVLGLIAYWFAFFLGESWIEDLVKSVLVGLLLIAAIRHTESAALTLGLLCGFVAATVIKFVGNEIPHRRAVRRREKVERDRFERRRRRARARAERLKKE